MQTCFELYKTNLIYFCLKSKYIFLIDILIVGKLYISFSEI